MECRLQTPTAGWKTPTPRRHRHVGVLLTWTWECTACINMGLYCSYVQSTCRPDGGFHGYMCCYDLAAAEGEMLAQCAYTGRQSGHRGAQRGAPVIALAGAGLPPEGADLMLPLLLGVGCFCCSCGGSERADPEGAEPV